MTGEGAPVLSVIVPAYNEAARIAGALERVAGYLASLPYDSELIVVDDGSDEAGRKAVEDALAVLRPGLARHVLRHETNRGKGAAVRTGCLAARGRYVAFIDADLASPPESLGDLIAALEGGADVAVGVRNQVDGTDMRNRRSLTRRLAGKAFAVVVGLLLLPGLRDSQCPLKAFRGEAAHRLFPLQRIDTWSFDAEVLYLARRFGMKVAQVPVAWSAVEGSHLRLTRSVGELVNLLRIRWMHRRVSNRQQATSNK
jgi:glycosyltransferase involved in cell wall biosynthesis